MTGPCSRTERCVEQSSEWRYKLDVPTRGHPGLMSSHHFFSLCSFFFFMFFRFLVFFLFLFFLFFCGRQKTEKLSKSSYCKNGDFPMSKFDFGASVCLV